MLQDQYVKQKWNQQVQSEIRSLQDAIDRHSFIQDSARKRKDMSTLSHGKRLMNKWFPKLKKEIEREQKRLVRELPPPLPPISVKVKFNTVRCII
jgi:cell fate (sporulation/competence/biofilm development) regulator YmcA (YheA/YmcA/DUF963 family)